VGGLECRATHTGTDNPLCCIPSRAAVSSESAGVVLHRYALAAAEGVDGEADGGYVGCATQLMYYALDQAAVGEGIRT
jgi:hypothetical protein